MKSDEHDDPPATRTASPSAAVEARSDHAPVASNRHRRPGSATQVRDPDRYDIVGEHGRGGLGRVSRAHDRDLGRDVAIKELISRGTTSEVRFVREALITARLEHPGIVPVHEAGRWPDGTPFYSMKLVAGRPLRDLIAERTTVEQRIGLLHHVIAVADAIAYAHGRNVIHRDLKPANVIVGEFGETIVIDWGLAKDLSVTDDSAGFGSEPYRVHHDNDLTAAGSVLGTPAYMAPEQERGEHVDQRADVFAIGAMLWELCALQRVPPTEAHVRHRMLRRAGIDRDLITILDKALDREPARRYANAGALAADLKAFKAGARIAARNYSLFGMLAHWIRRHRALTLAVAAAIAIATTSMAVYVHNIASERDLVEVANNNLILEHAELLLHSNPTAAVDALAGYRGDNILRRRRLLAEARGRGVARSTFHPHTGTVAFTHGDPTGDIISLADDGNIQLTRAGTSTTLASDVSSGLHVRFAPHAQLLAYITTSRRIALLDLTTKKKHELSVKAPIELEFSLDGARLASTDESGQLTVWNLQDDSIVHQEAITGIKNIHFMTSSRLIVQDQTSIRIVEVQSSNLSITSWMSSNIVSLDTRPDLIATGSDIGELEILSARLIPLRGLSVCHKQISYLFFISNTYDIVYSCRGSGSGIARYSMSENTIELIETFETHGPTVARPDFSGRYITITDDSTSAYVWDTHTKLMSHYDGFSGRPTTITAPSTDFNYVLIGDSKGTVSLWNPPSGSARVIQRAPTPTFAVSFSLDSRYIVTNGVDRVFRQTRIDDKVTTEFRGHKGGVYATRMSPDGTSMLSYSYDGTVRVWDTANSKLIRAFAEHSNVVEEAKYIEGGRRIASIGDDGRLLVWSPQGTDVEILFKHASPLIYLQVLRNSNHLVVADRGGSIWDIPLEGKPRQVRNADHATLTALRASADGTLLAAGTDTGLVTVYDTLVWDIARIATTTGRVLQVEFDPLGRDMMIAADANPSQTAQVQLISLNTTRAPRWSTVFSPVRRIAYAQDGETIGFTCVDGGVWLYSMHDDLWSYARDHEAGGFAAEFSPNGDFFVSTDRQGRTVIRDVKSSFATAEHEQRHSSAGTAITSESETIRQPTIGPRPSR